MRCSRTKPIAKVIMRIEGLGFRYHEVQQNKTDGNGDHEGREALPAQRPLLCPHRLGLSV